MKTIVKNIFFAILAFIILVSLFSSFGNFSSDDKNIISLSELSQKIKASEVSEIEVEGDKLIAHLKNGAEVESKKESESSITETFANLGLSGEELAGVDIKVKSENSFGFIMLSILPILLPFLLIFFFLWFLFRHAKAGQMQDLNFGTSCAQLFDSKKEQITFKDVAGAQEAKDELREIVEFLRSPGKFLAIGARIPRGVLLMGAPGTGKTLMARAVAGEAKVPFFFISGSEFVEMFVGVGASRVRDLFKNAKKQAPAIIFIDEIDAVGRQRGTGLGGGHDEREQTLNQILTEMDGFDRETNIIVMAATNRPDILDPALLRPGRFDRRIMIDEPDINDREKILKIHIKEKKVEKDINLRLIAERTPGFSGADLANLINESAILAARRNKKKITQIELIESIEKVLLGPARKSNLLSKKEKEIAAYHEAGHALVASALPSADPVHKISIISRGKAGGYTLKLPSEEIHFYSKARFEDELATLLAGYEAEKLVFNEITTGPTNDIRMASGLARKIVTEYGMSPKLGPISFGEKSQMVFLGKEISEQRNYSEEIAALIDDEVSTLITEAQERAAIILKKHRSYLNKIAKVLIKKETIEQEEFKKLILGLVPAKT